MLSYLDNTKTDREENKLQLGEEEIVGEETYKDTVGMSPVDKSLRKS